MFNYLQRNTALGLKKTNIRLIPYGGNEQSMKTIGKTKLVNESKTCYVEDEFFIVDTDNLNLIGGNLALNLKLISLNKENIDKQKSTYDKPIHANNISLINKRVYTTNLFMQIIYH